MLRSAVTRGAFAHAMKASVAQKSAASAFPVLRLPLAGASKQSASSSTHAFLKAMQTHAFATIPTGKDETAPSSKKTFEELLEENAALRKQVVELEEKVKNKPGKFMTVISQFGLPFVVWWTTLYVGTGAALYVAFDTGLIAGADAIKFIMDMGLDRFIDVNTLNPTYGNIALAAVLNECLEPLRFPIALATIPTIKRIFSKDKAPEVKA